MKSMISNRNERITPEQVEEVTASFHRVEELLGGLFEDKREAREQPDSVSGACG